jgi:lipopolysaccharide transport system ATP-binding protein
MSRAEIKRKFDEIVAFAEIEKFLDTPVRRYSSGMYMRLAFAIAAHLEPEILIVDEVLAVGDAEFQKKCLGKMGQVAKQGRTVLVVSHQLGTITNLCSKAMLLRDGRLVAVGMPQEIMKEYLKPRAAREARAIIQRPPWAEPLIQQVGSLGPHGEDQEVFSLGSNITLEMSIQLPPGRKISSPIMGIYINHMLFGVVGRVDTHMTGYHPSSISCPQFIMRCKLLAPPLLQGNYTADLWFGDGQQELDVAKECVSFRVEGADIYGTGRVPDDSAGVVYFRSDWETLELPSSN